MTTVTIAGREVEISKTEKLFYPDDSLTKGDVVEHFQRVAEVMVPHLRGRPLTLRRFPDGITGEGWFQKEASDYFPDWLRVASVPQRGRDGHDGRDDRGNTVHYAVCEDAASLVYLANQATLEFHIWTSTLDALNNPDLLVLDLDPPEQATLRKLRELTRRTRDLLAEIGLTPYLQCTGGRGYHVVAPLDASANFEVVRHLAGQAADHVAVAEPEQATTQLRKNKRGERIFIDANRNGYAQTFIAPYSLRSRPGASVATPLDWSELGKTEPNEYDPAKLHKRLARKRDPWQDMRRHPSSARRAQQRLDKLG